MFFAWPKNIDRHMNCSSGAQSVKLKKKKIGAILIEVAFTLPVVVYLMFFCIELIKINITKESLQSICEEATYLTIAHDYSDGKNLRDKIDAIIAKYRPSFIPENAKEYTSAEQPVIRYYFCTYSSLDEMLKSSPYGGSTIAYPCYENDVSASLHAGAGYDHGAEIIPSQGWQRCENPYNWEADKNYLRDGGSGFPKNRVFVMTISCDYPFSSAMVKMLFGGGVNSAKAQKAGYSGVLSSSSKGKMYLLWARGTGIVN